MIPMSTKNKLHIIIQASYLILILYNQPFKTNSCLCFETSKHSYLEKLKLYETNAESIDF